MGALRRSTVRRAMAVLLAGLALAALAGCRNDADRPGALRIAAASDLRDALTAMQSELEQRCSARVTFVFGSSGTLKEQILAGADYDLFLSADEGYVEDLARAGRLAPDGRAVYALGHLALAWRKDLPPLTAVSDLTRADVRRIAIANPGHAPYGRAAEEALRTAGLWDAVQPRIVLGESVRQATDYVRGGNADVGLVALALVIQSDTPYQVVDSSLHRPIRQAAGVIQREGGEQGARCALRFIVAPEGQAVLRRFGFEPVPAP